MMPQNPQFGQFGPGFNGECGQVSDMSPPPGDNGGLLPLVGGLGVIFRSPTSGQPGSSGSPSPSSTPSASGSTTGFVINVIYDQSPSSLPAGFVAAVNYVVGYYESLFTGPGSLNIDLGFGEIANQAMSPGALGESETYLADYSYASAKSALAAIDATAAANMPSGMPVSGTMWTSTAQAKALGLPLQQPSTDIDGFVGLSSTYPFAYDPNNRAVSGAYDFIGVLEHEFAEVMGRMDLFGQTIGSTPNGYTLLDMFHYTASGTHTYTGTTTNYFSVDGGTTNLDNFNSNSGGDLGDWASTAGRDAYLAFSPSGQANSVSQSDITEMNALGWGLAGSSGTGLPDLSASVGLSSTTLAAGSSATVDFYDLNFGSGAAPASSTAIYLSTDANITTSDTLLTTVSSPALGPHTPQAPGWYDHESVAINLSGNLAPGTYYIGAIADYTNAIGESDEANNTYNVTQITVTGPAKPDLSASVGLGSTTLAAGSSATVDFYDLNFGAGAAPASSTAIYLSTDANITTSDTLLTTVNSPALGPHTPQAPGWYDHESVAINLSGNLAPGTYYIGAIADYTNAIGESDETNNTYNVIQITVVATAHASTGSSAPVDSDGAAPSVQSVRSDPLAANLELLNNYMAAAFVPPAIYDAGGSAFQTPGDLSPTTLTQPQHM